MHVVAVILALLTILNPSRSPDLLRDTDTAVVIQTIQQRQDPMSWFSGDWPLKNHFYRPVSALTFEMDLAKGEPEPATFAQTNAVLVGLCILALYWVAWEVLSKPVAIVAPLAFTAWCFDRSDLLYWAAIAIGTTTTILWWTARKSRPPTAVGVITWICGFIFCTDLAIGVRTLNFRMIGWIPGRTASTMALFGLLAIGAYLRSVRKQCPLWLTTSALSTLLALGAYEQAVILPGVMLILGFGGVWSMPKLQRIWWVGIPCLMVLIYLVVRSQTVPFGASGYQMQQFRSGPGVWVSLGEYFAPGLVHLPYLLTSVSVGISALLLPTLYAQASRIIATPVTLANLIKVQDFRLILACFIAAGVSFAPMAWFKEFDHYHFLPMALRALVLAAITEQVWRKLVSPKLPAQA